MFEITKRLMEIQGVLRRINNTACYIRAMVGDTLEIRQYIRPDEAHFHAALAVSHTKNVACPHIFLHLVDDLLQRFNVLRLSTVVVNKRID